MCNGPIPCQEIIEVKLMVTQTHASVAKMEKLLTGNGEPERGLIVRVDRIERRALRHGAVIKTILVTWVAAAAAAVFAWFRSGAT
tara:strand:+ start:10400 stop:10654 length:255 start_codon:yes stop_codon:yes gene_type:complete